jgi:hypothetical protein
MSDGEQGWKPRRAVRKVLTGFLACCGLVFVIGSTAGCGSPSSATTAAAAGPDNGGGSGNSTARASPDDACATARAACYYGAG